jgi:hypothetical protein
MSESDHTSTLDPQAAAPTPAQPASPTAATHDPAHPAYAAMHQPRFVDRVLGMRAVIAVALAALIIGGLSGFLLGEHTNGGDDRFGHGGPGGFPGGQGFRGGPQGTPGQQNFGQGQAPPGGQ